MKTSPLANKNLMLEAINASNSIKEVLSYLGLRAAGGNYRMAKHWATIHNLELPVGTGLFQVGNAHKTVHLSHAEIFCENSTANRSTVKSKLRKIWLVWVCAECGVGEEWKGKKLVLQLDHINGIFNDHRIDNLRLLCPNCHSQTETFSGKRLKLCQDIL